MSEGKRKAAPKDKTTPKVDDNPTLNAALRYAKRGWRVLPLYERIGDGSGDDKCGCKNPECSHQGKHPIGAFAPNGFKNATTDVDTIKRWWGKRPKAGIGVATGKASGIIVFDLDLKGDKDGVKALNELWIGLGGLPDTKTAQTPSRGRHLYYRYAEGIGSSNGVIGPGIDIKGDGGYIVAPPSHGLYQWIEGRKAAELPAKWIEHLRRPPRDTKRKQTRARKPFREEIEAALAAVKNDAIANRPRDEWINIGQAIWEGTDGSEEGFELFDAWSKQWPRYEHDATRRAWESFNPQEITVATLFHKADEADPSWRDALDWSQDEEGDHEHDNKSQADVLIDLAAEAELFHDHDGAAHADITVEGHRETWPIKSKGFRSWLAWQYYKANKGAPNPQAVTTALATIEARAQFNSPKREVFFRVTDHDGRIYIDLADEAWRAVEIDSSGWRVISDPPVRFRRRGSMRALPEPVRGGSLETLRGYLNIKKPDKDDRDDQFVLIVAWLLQALRGRGPYPVLAVTGEAGSAKSTLLEILRFLIDPNAVRELRAPPREDRDLFIAASNSYVLGYDNLSGMPGWLSDTFARISTGGGFATRQLYTDDEERLFSGSRPILLGGIENVVVRGDLTERCIFLKLRPITEQARRPVRELWAQFTADRPRILGALLDVMVEGLRRFPETHPSELPRMADFAQWIAACEGALWTPGTFAAAYTRNRMAALVDVLEADGVAMAVRSFVTRVQEWDGRVSDLLGFLNGEVDEQLRSSKHWPKAPNALSGRLTRAASTLRSHGIDVSDYLHAMTRRKMVRLRLTTSSSPANDPSDPSILHSADISIGYSDQDPSPPMHGAKDDPVRAKDGSAGAKGHGFSNPLKNNKIEGSKGMKDVSRTFRYRPDMEARLRYALNAQRRSSETR